jgi:PAS domain S-box-containing protein
MQPMESQELYGRHAARYGFAVVCLAAATVLRGVLASVLGNASVPFLTYFPAVVLTSWYGGLGPGLVVTGLAALIAQFFFMEPVGTFHLRNAGDGVALLIFTGSSILMVWLNETRERERRKSLTLAADAGERIHTLEERIRAMDEAEQDAAEYKRWAGDTLSSIGDGVICTDVDGCVTFLNAVAERLTGWTLAEARGKDIADVFVIINEHTRKPASNPIRRVLEEGTIMGLANHTLLVSRDGREISIDDSGAPIRGPKDKKITGAVLVFRDMAERKSLEDELRRTAKELENTNRELAAFAYTCRSRCET